MARAGDWSFEPEPGLRVGEKVSADRLGRAVRARRARPATRASPTSSASRPSSPACRGSSSSCRRSPAATASVDPAVLVVCRKLGHHRRLPRQRPGGTGCDGVRHRVDPPGPQGRRPRLAGRHVRPGRAATPRRGHDDGARPDREPRDRRRLRRPRPPGRRPADRGRARHRLVGRARDDVGRSWPTPTDAELARQLADLPDRAGRRGAGVARHQRRLRARRRPRRGRRGRQPLRPRAPPGRGRRRRRRRRRRRAGQRRRDPRRPAHAVQRGQLRDRLPGIAADVGLRRGVLRDHGRGVPASAPPSPAPTTPRSPGWRRRSSPSPTTRASPRHAAALRRRM